MNLNVVIAAERRQKRVDEKVFWDYASFTTGANYVTVVSERVARFGFSRYAANFARLRFVPFFGTGRFFIFYIIIMAAFVRANRTYSVLEQMSAGCLFAYFSAHSAGFVRAACGIFHVPHMMSRNYVRLIFGGATQTPV